MKKNNLLIKAQTPIVWIQCTSNNTLLTLTDYKGSTLSWSSGGVCGFKNSRKSTTHAAEIAAIDLAEKIYKKGFKKISVKTRGIGRGKKKALAALSRSGLFLEKITEYSCVPFNGCRVKRGRKI